MVSLLVMGWMAASSGGREAKSGTEMKRASSHCACAPGALSSGIPVTSALKTVGKLCKVFRLLAGSACSLSPWIFWRRIETLLSSSGMNLNEEMS